MTNFLELPHRDGCTRGSNEKGNKSRQDQDGASAFQPADMTTWPFMGKEPYFPEKPDAKFGTGAINCVTLPFERNPIDKPVRRGEIPTESACDQQAEASMSDHVNQSDNAAKRAENVILESQRRKAVAQVLARVVIRIEQEKSHE